MVLFGCAGTELKLHDWTELPDEHYTIPPYAKHLAKYKIALDPGHGGKAELEGYKRGPSGKREAIMNLNVALFLKEFLEQAGVKVFLTRTEDVFVSLEDRAYLAKAAGCDFMISLHHNTSRNPQTNFAAVFYHLTPDTSPFSMDLARNIYFGLVEALHLPQVLEDGLMTDKTIFPDGFGLLRSSQIPAILLESSFYSNPDEEKRLTNLRYNRREAYGIFLGLARWAAGGVPRTQMLQPLGVTQNKQPQIEYRLYDGLTERVRRNLDEQLIYSSSVSAKIDSQIVPVKLSATKDRISFRPDSSLSNGFHEIQVDEQNIFKNHNLPRIDTLVIAAATDSISFDVATHTLPADPNALLPIQLKLFDADGQPVWDSTQVHLQTNRGTVAPVLSRLRDGKATVYFKSVADVNPTVVTATADDHNTSLLLALQPPGQTWLLSGAVLDDSTNTPIAGAPVLLNDSLYTLTDDNGVYSLLNPPIGETKLTIAPRGYTEALEEIEIDSSASHLINFRVKANLSGLLYDEVVILDAALGGEESGDLFSDTLNAAQENLSLIRQLADTLAWVGAFPVLVREDSTRMSSQQRIRKVNALPDGWYLKFGYRYWDKDSVKVQATIYPANEKGERVAEAINEVFSDLPNTRFTLSQNTEVPEVTLTNKTAIEVILTCRQPRVRSRDLPRLFQAIIKFQKRQIEEEAKKKQALQEFLRSQQTF